MRKKVCLNGEWDFMPDFIGRSPEQLIDQCVWEKEKILVPSSWKWKIQDKGDYEPYNLFCYPDHWDQAESGILGRSFEAVPQKGERVFLIFKGVLQQWQVFINGKKALESKEAFLPVEIDITDFLNIERPNAMIVWCGPFPSVETAAGKKQTAPSGSWFAQGARGIWQDVYLEYRNQEYLQAPYITTSYRQKTLTAEILAICPEDRIASMNRKTVTFSVMDHDSVVMAFSGSLSKDECRERSGESAYCGSVDWVDPECWMPDHPHLYEFRADLTEDGILLDRVETAFGFREVWFDAFKFYLNGVRINLRGDAWHYQGFVYQTKDYALNWYRLCRETGINFIRLHAMPYPEFFLEAADECGMLIVDESAIYGSSKTIQADCEDYIAQCESHLRALIMRDRNHPCIIQWSMQNEMRWVDGRDGYKKQMKNLVSVIKALDATRAVSFDGDIHLADPGDTEVISMHYNIDGNIAEWEKKKPLFFGEHGKWHYISPQVTAGLIGEKACLSADSCLLGIGREESHFIEYARREEVTAICPFNTAYYMMEAMPGREEKLLWNCTDGPGVKPRVIPAYALTVNNGFLPAYPAWTPNASYAPVAEAFQPCAVIADEYDDSFYPGENLTRNFSVYNDSFSAAQTTLKYWTKNSLGEILQAGSKTFFQLPGERKCVALVLYLTEMAAMMKKAKPEQLTLDIRLFHNEEKVFTTQKEYKIYPFNTGFPEKFPKKIVFIGERAHYDLVKDFCEADYCQGSITLQKLQKANVVILGKNAWAEQKDSRAIFQQYAESGGFLFIMEQENDAPGDLILTGRACDNAMMTMPNHPVFKGLSQEDFSCWRSENTNSPCGEHLSSNAYFKPSKGDVKILLECGTGDFGNGGLLWTTMLEYRAGKGHILLQQMDLTNRFNSLPQARILFGNILAYASALKNKPYCPTGILVPEQGKSVDFLQKTGLVYKNIMTEIKTKNTGWMDRLGLIIADPEILDDDIIPKLHKFVRHGGRLLMLPMEPAGADPVSAIAGTAIVLRKKTAYQVAPVMHALTEGISAFDSYHFEKVTYTPENKHNTVIARYSAAAEGMQRLFVNTNAPWEELFVNGQSDEPVKQATIQMVKDRFFEDHCYGGYLSLDKGGILLCQLDLQPENEKLLRLYARLLSNLGAEFRTEFLEHTKEESDVGIPALMAIQFDPMNDYLQEEAYFSDENFTLNPIGEGVYGQMSRIEKNERVLRIANSANRTFFATLFVRSDINRNPFKRNENQMPDASIMPDLILSVNCVMKLFINGRLMYEQSNPDSVVRTKIPGVMLDKGINRMAMTFQGAAEDITFSGTFADKYGDFVTDLRYFLTLD